MRFLVMIYTDQVLLDGLPDGRADEMMRGCLANADRMRDSGALIDSQQLKPPTTAKTLRVREGKPRVVDGPFAETKEFLGGFNLIEAADMDEAIRIASSFPWATIGSIEIRPVIDMNEVRRRVELPA